MPENTELRQRERRRSAWRSAWTATIMQAATAGALLVLRGWYGISGFPGGLMLALALLDLAMVIPVWVLLKQRLKEIEGGEEDAAAQY